MENLSMCRICLATDVRLCSMASHLQDMYERITAETFQREDTRPLVACYICHARLQNCYRLRMSCLRSGELLTEMMSSGVLKPQDVCSTNSFSVVSAVHISIGHVLQETTECNVKDEAPEITCDDEFDLQYSKDMMKEELCEQIDDDNQYSHVEDPLEVINSQADDIETDAEEVKLEIEVTVLEENKQNGADQLSQSADNKYPEIEKVVLERIDLKDSWTGIPVFKKLPETDFHLVTDPEDDAFNKNIDFGQLIAASNTYKTNDKVGATLQRDNKVMDHYEGHKQMFESNFSSINKSCFTKDLDRDTCTSTRENWFHCDVCKKCFKNRSNFKKHMFKHTGEKQYECDVCNKCFASKKHLIQHMYTHTNEKRFQCDVCSKCFKREQYLTQHMYSHTGEKPFQCDVCKNCFASKTHLTRHMHTHTDEKRFQCGVCNKCFKREPYLTQHMYTHTDEKQFQCVVCNKFLGSKVSLTKHMSIHTGEKPFQCDVCNKSFRWKHRLTDHMFTHTGEKRFQCDVCNKCFRSKPQLTQHLYTHTGEKRFHCDVCNKFLSSKVNLTRHMSTHTGEKPYQCDVCNKCFASKKHLTQHTYIHTDDKSFQCDVCNKYFKREQYLTQHMNVHAEEKQFKCDVCNKFLGSKVSLKRHMRTHTGEKPFQCDVCNKYFRWKHHLTYHMSYTHAGEKRF